MATGEQTDQVFADTKALAELLKRLQENLTRSSDKNDGLLEAIESTEARASEAMGGGEVGYSSRGGGAAVISTSACGFTAERRCWNSNA